jgi:hypothetical protein
MDVERVVRREYPPEEFESIMALLDEYGSARWHTENRDRVQLAALKLAAGDRNQLTDYIRNMVDWRDLIVYAEYPLCTRTKNAFNLPEDRQQELFDQDWAQNAEWLNRQ